MNVALYKKRTEPSTFNNSKIHIFKRENRTFGIGMKSMILYEINSHWRWFKRQREYTPISILSPDKRVLHNDEKAVIAKRQEFGIYCYLNISHSCNMSCQYCFAKQGKYGGSEELMDISIAKETIDWLCRSSKGREVSINFFGGEPLVNAEVLYKTIAYAKIQTQHYNKSLRVRVSTNGTRDLCELGSALIGERHNIAVSIDGPPSIQNRNRPLRDGGPSYERVKKNITNYIKHFGVNHISAKATWRRGQNNLIETAKDLLSIGFMNISICRESAFGGGTVEPENKGSQKDFDEILLAYDKLSSWYIKQLNAGKEIVLEPLTTTMGAILELRLIKSRCPVGNSSFCVNPEGEIYPCHRFVGETSYMIGKVCNPQEELQIPSVCKSLTPLPQSCNECWAKNWCVSDNCVYLNAINKDLRSLNGFCKHIKDFLEAICFHLSNLTGDGRRVFLKIQNRESRNIARVKVD